MDELSGIEREKRMRTRSTYEPLLLPILDAKFRSNRSEGNRGARSEEDRILERAHQERLDAK